MVAVWTLVFSYIRTKKLQNGLTGLLILLSTLLLGTAVMVILNTQNLFMDMHQKTNGSHQILTLGGKLHNPQKIKEWWDRQEGVQSSELIPFRNLSGVSFKGQEKPSLYLFMMDTPKAPFAVDKLIFAQGEERLTPSAGTIWIPTSLAYANDISLGDKLGFHTGQSVFELEVSAIVVDIPYGAPFTVNARIWMNDQDYREQFQPMQGKDMYMMGLRFDDYQQNSSYWKRFEKDLGTPFLEGKMEFEEISSFYLIMNKIIGFVMIFLGIVMLLVALFTIGFTISDAILANYKTIGVLKSLGLSSIRTIGTYLTQYAFLSFVSIIPGLIISSFLSSMLVESSLSYLKTDSTAAYMRGQTILLAVGLIVFILVITCVIIYANKVRSVQPAQAIRYGMSERDSSKLSRRMNHAGKHSLGFERFPVTLVIGLRNIVKNRKGSILMMVLAVITSSVLVLGFVLLNSIASIQQTAAMWGYDSSHLVVSIFNKSAFSRVDFEKDVKSDPRFKNIGWLKEATGVIHSENSLNGDTNSQSMSISLSVVDGSYDDIGYRTIMGNNPRHKNEIALGINVAKKLNKDLGDAVDIYIEGQKHTLIVTGIYQAIANMSYSARMISDMSQASTTDDIDSAGFINLNDRSDSDRFVDELNMKYPDSIKAVTQKTLLDAVYKEASSILIWPMSFMGLLFILVTFIIIYSTCRINVRKESKTYGIYKSIGMTSRRIRFSVTLGTMVLSAIGALIGAVAGVYILPLILKNLLSGYGIVKLPLVLNWGGIMAVVCVSIVAAILGSWLSSRVIAKTSPRILVIE